MYRCIHRMFSSLTGPHPDQYFCIIRGLTVLVHLSRLARYESMKAYYFTPPPCRGAEFCDKGVCLSADIFGKLHDRLHKIICACSGLCCRCGRPTFGFVANVMFTQAYCGVPMVTYCYRGSIVYGRKGQTSPLCKGVPEVCNTPLPFLPEKNSYLLLCLTISYYVLVMT